MEMSGAEPDEGSKASHSSSDLETPEESHFLKAAASAFQRRKDMLHQLSLGFWCLRCTSWCCFTLALSCVLLLAYLGLASLLDAQVSSALISVCEQFLGTPVTLVSVNVDVRALSVWVVGFRIGSPPGFEDDLVAVDSIGLELGSAGSLLDLVWGLVFSAPVLLQASRLEAHGLRFSYEQRNGSSNLGKIIDHEEEVVGGKVAGEGAAQEAAGAAQEAPWLKVIVDRLYITDCTAGARIKHHLLDALQGPLRCRIPSVVEADVGKQQRGITLAELGTLILGRAAHAVVPEGSSLDSLSSAFLVSAGRHYLGVNTSVRAVGMDFWSRSWWISGLSVASPPAYAGDFLGVEGIVFDVALDTRSSLIELALNITRSKPILVRLSALGIHGLHVFIEERDGSSNVKEINEHLQRMLYEGVANATERRLTDQAAARSGLRVIVDRIHITDAYVQAKVLDSSLLQPGSFQVVHAIHMEGVGKEQNGMSVGVLCELLLSEVLNDVAKRAPASLKSPLQRISSWALAMHQTAAAIEGIFAPLEHLPTHPPAYVPPGYQACGSLACETARPCCRGICGPRHGFCCGKVSCTPGSICCNGFCLTRGTACLFNNTLGQQFDRVEQALITLSKTQS